MSAIKFQHIKKRYGSNNLTVKDFHLDVVDKEFLVLVGPSGCGKSTTLRMIAGLEDISEGKLFIGDKVVNDMPPKDRDIAMVFQNYALYPHMTVYKNMAFGLKLRKFPKDEIERRVLEAAKILEIEHLLDRKPKALSGGQRQRVALGRAIVRDPQVFLMDEPLSNLDAKLRVQMRAEINKLHKRLGTTIVYVTHDQTEAMTMGDRIVVMYDGVIQQVASPQDIYYFPKNKFVAGFIGSPSMNFVDGVINEQGGRLYFTSENLKLAIPYQQESALRNKGYVDKEITLGIRPENMKEQSEDEGEDGGGDGETTFQGEVEVIENMGSGLVLYVSVGNYSLIAAVEGKTEPRIGGEIKLAIDMKKCHFFDIDTEQAIR